MAAVGGEVCNLQKYITTPDQPFLAVVIHIIGRPVAASEGQQEQVTAASQKKSKIKVTTISI
jgi:hypothetical protein